MSVISSSCSLTAIVSRRLLISDSATSFLLARHISLSPPHRRTKGPIKVKTTDSNLQKLKHIKYSDEFIRKEVDRFNLSKRRLANMMGEDPNTFGEDDVKRAIRYLFPSDLDENSLPRMDHPVKVYTSRLRIHWDESKRPFHFLYYTRRPIAYELLHDTYQYVLDARKVEAENDEKKVINLEGTRWMTMEEISNEILDGEVINAAVYNQIIAQLERLVEERNSYIAEEFVMKHRKVIPKITMMDNVVEAIDMEDGRKCVTCDAQKKSAIASVKLINPGTGKVTVNNKDFHKHFPFIEDRRTVLSPFTLLKQLAKYDVEVFVEGGITKPASIGDKVLYDDYNIPSSSQAVAIRLAIAKGLRSFVTAEEIEMMRRAGLLTFDKRWKERKVYGQHRARKKHTWKRR